MNRTELLVQLKGKGISEDVLRAMSKVPREVFVPEGFWERAYNDEALPIQKGVTLSQPYTVAYMIDLLDIGPNARVLEIGTGTGYNASVMSRLAEQVYTVEVVHDLVRVARENIEKIGIDNVYVIEGSGVQGYAPRAPYDRIMVTAGADEVPEALIDQLKKGGAMVIPINEGRHQVMTRLEKKNGLKRSTHGEFRFVPLV